jgi:hypothetical protein
MGVFIISCVPLQIWLWRGAFASQFFWAREERPQQEGHGMVHFKGYDGMTGKGSPWICPKRGWHLGGVGPFGVVARVQEVTVTPGELRADADLIHYTMGASEKDEEVAIRKASDGRS